MNGWNCQICKGYNDILNITCIFCFSDKPEWITDEYQIRVEINRGIFYQRLLLTMTKDEELFAKYYTAGKILVESMTDDALLTHISDLKEILLEARAHMQAATDKIRESRKGKNKDWLVSVETDQVTSEAIAAVSVRKDRMSKLDKLREQLLKGGMDEEIVNEMIRNMNSKATETSLKSVNFPVVKSDNKPKEPEKKTIIDIVKEEKQPFDPSKLKFGS